MLPNRKTAELLAEFLPIKAAEGHVTVRKRTLTVGARLEKQSAPAGGGHSINDLRAQATRTQHAGRYAAEFVVSVDTAHVRCTDPKSARNFEIVVARCGRGGMRPGQSYFATTDTSQVKCGHGRCKPFSQKAIQDAARCTILSDGAEIMKRLPRALSKPATHIIDWVHLAMKINQ